ncbi:hypothetical protein ACFLS1_00055 [Verrucomicrobiota bacterium]
MTNAWKKFIIQYLIVAVAGTTAIYFSVGCLRNQERVYQTRSTQPRPRQTTKTIAKIEEDLEQILWEKPDLEKIDIPSETSGKKPAVNTHLKWGVVKSSGANAYNESYKFLRKIAPGTLVEVSETKTVSKENLALCSVHHNNRLVPNIYIRAENLDLRSGSLDTANPEEKKLRSDQSKVAAQLRTLLKEQQAFIKSNNPYAEEYETSKKTYNEFWKKTEILQKKRDSSTGAERIEIADELRRMKGKNIKLVDDFKSAKKKYSDWNAKKLTDNPKFASLKSELSKIQSELLEVTQRP